MNFVHTDPEFSDLLRIVGRDTGLSPALVEKDYWVTHTLWSLHQTRLDVWFKGGTSLSKGFSLIKRFSEDLDLRIESGKAEGVPAVTSWKSENKGPVARRLSFFGALETAVTVPGAEVRLDREQIDARARAATYRVLYPGRFLEGLPSIIRPFVLMEVGSARVVPWIVRPLTSFVHDWLETAGRMREHRDNRPRSVRCVHPMVTLVEKLDAISRRYARPAMEPASFVRHYEDAARIIAAAASLPPLEVGIKALVADMHHKGDIARRPLPDDPAFKLADPDRREALEKVHQVMAPMFWGERLSVRASCRIIKAWLRHQA